MAKIALRKGAITIQSSANSVLESLPKGLKRVAGENMAKKPPQLVPTRSFARQAESAGEEARGSGTDYGVSVRSKFSTPELQANLRCLPLL